MDKTNEQTQAGYVLVPVEPTEEMMNAGYDATRKSDGMPQFMSDGFCLGHTDKIYRAMLAAAPQAQPVAEVHAKGTEPEGDRSLFTSEVLALYDKADIAPTDTTLSAFEEGFIVGKLVAASQSPATAQAQPVEAEQAGAEAHGLDDLRRDLIADTCEVFDASGSETFQVVRDVIEYVDSWLQVQVGRAADRAKAQPKVVGKPAQPVREPMSDDQILGALQLVAYEKPNRLPVVFSLFAHAIERHHGITKDQP